MSGGLGEIVRLIREKGIWHVLGNMRRNARYIYATFSRGGSGSLNKPLIQQQESH